MKSVPVTAGRADSEFTAHFYFLDILIHGCHLELAWEAGEWTIFFSAQLLRSNRVCQVRLSMATIIWFSPEPVDHLAHGLLIKLQAELDEGALGGVATGRKVLVLEADGVITHIQPGIFNDGPPDRGTGAVVELISIPGVRYASTQIHVPIPCDVVARFQTEQVENPV